MSTSKDDKSGSSSILEVPPAIANDKDTIKEAVLSLRQNIEKWVFLHLGETVDMIRLSWDLTRTAETGGVSPMCWTFDVPDTEESIQSFKELMREFPTEGKNHFLYLWIWILLEKAFFHRTLPLGFTQAENNRLRDIWHSLVDENHDKGDLKFAQWRHKLLEKANTVQAEPRAVIEKEQFNDGARFLLKEISSKLRLVMDGPSDDLVESVMKPAYALVRAMETSSIPFQFAWTMAKFREEINSQDLADETLRDIRSGETIEPAEAQYLVRDQYPCLVVNEHGDENWEILVPAVILVRRDTTQEDTARILANRSKPT